jgi:hypothetical protein
MNGLEILYHMLFVEPESFLWGLITMGIIIAILSFLFDIGAEQNNE